MRGRRRLWLSLLAVPLVLLAADTAYWRLVAGNLERGFANWVSVQKAHGWTEQNGRTSVGGWPFAAILVVPALSLTHGGSDMPGRVFWSAERVKLRIALMRPAMLEIAPEGQQQVRLADNPAVAYTAGRLRLLLPLQAKDWPDFAELAVANLRAETPTGVASVGSLQLQLVFHPEARSGEPAVIASLQAGDLGLPPRTVRPLGPNVAKVEMEAALNGPLPVAGAPADQATSWRDGGGSLAIQHLVLTWGPLDLSASATLALDDQLQPMGAGTAHIVGYAETLDTLAAHSMISRSAATAAKAVLSLLANAPGDGSRPDVEVPLTLQYRTLSMRQVPLLRLPEVDWP
jgi:Uncharacterized protein conserved in bacteria (DUF2125)